MKTKIMKFENITVNAPCQKFTEFKYVSQFVSDVSDYLCLFDFQGAVDIQFMRDLEGDGGWSSGDNQTVDISIALNDSQGPIPIEEMLRNVAHELVHAQQFLSGRLDNFEWEGTNYAGTSYENRPWEIEAYGMEEELCSLQNRFLD
jgi:hypothetical protein